MQESEALSDQSSISSTPSPFNRVTGIKCSSDDPSADCRLWQCSPCAALRCTVLCCAVLLVERSCGARRPSQLFRDGDASRLGCQYALVLGMGDGGVVVIEEDVEMG